MEEALTKLFPIDCPEVTALYLCQSLAKETLPTDSHHWHDQYPARGSILFVRYCFDYLVKTYPEHEVEVRDTLRETVQAAWQSFWTWIQFFVEHVLERDFPIRTAADLDILHFCRTSLINFILIYHDLPFLDGEGSVLSRAERCYDLVALLFESAIFSSDVAIITSASQLILLWGLQPKIGSDNLRKTAARLATFSDSAELAAECLALVYNPRIPMDSCHALVHIFCRLSVASRHPLPTCKRSIPVYSLAKALSHLCRRFGSGGSQWHNTLLSCGFSGLRYLLIIFRQNERHLQQYVLQAIEGKILPVLLNMLLIAASMDDLHPRALNNLHTLCNYLLSSMNHCLGLGSRRLATSLEKAVKSVQRCGIEVLIPDRELCDQWMMLVRISTVRRDQWRRFLQRSLKACQGPKV